MKLATLKKTAPKKRPRATLGASRVGGRLMVLSVQVERELDGRWLAEVPELPGVMAYGVTKRLTLRRLMALAKWRVGDMKRQGELAPFARIAFKFS